MLKRKELLRLELHVIRLIDSLRNQLRSVMVIGLLMVELILLLLNAVKIIVIGKLLELSHSVIHSKTRMELLKQEKNLVTYMTITGMLQNVTVIILEM